MDKETNKAVLLKELIENYKRSHRKSEEFFKKSSKFLIQGGSHRLRLFMPFPFYDVECRGSKVTDIDGNTYVDFWQGHFANILGHNPQIILDALKNYLNKGQGLISGFPGLYQKELAELILNRISADKIRFSTSGTLSAMYAIMLARAYTKRDIVMKVAGGWHGAQPYTLKGISSFDKGLNLIESAGLPDGMDESIIVTTFNDIEDLEGKFRKHGERAACLIIEPFIGAGGFIFSHKEYLQKARDLTEKYGALLILDEVVTGFRFHAGALQSIYGIKPDLTILGKAIGGGMPVSAVAGIDPVMALCRNDIDANLQVKFEGGTFSAHPAVMVAGVAYLQYLIQHEKEIYPKIGLFGKKARKEIEDIFASHGYYVQCTGGNDNVDIESSFVGVHFLKEKRKKLSSPSEVFDPDINDYALREQIFKLAMLEEGFNIFHGFGAISAAHSESEIQAALDAVERIAKKWRGKKLNLN